MLQKAYTVVLLHAKKLHDSPTIGVLTGVERLRGRGSIRQQKEEETAIKHKEISTRRLQ